MNLAEVMQRSGDLFDSISGYVNTIVIALVILLSGFIIGKLVDRLLHMLLIRTKYDDKAFKVFGARRHYARATRRGIVYLIYVVTIYLAFRQLNLERAALTFVLGLLVLIVLVSFVLATIEIVPSLLARAKLKRRLFTIGDTVEVQKGKERTRGKVVRMSLTDVHIKRSNGDIVFFPNTTLLQAKITRKARKK